MDEIQQTSFFGFCMIFNDRGCHHGRRFIDGLLMVHGGCSRWWFQIIEFYVHPHLGILSNLTNIFQMGCSTTNQVFVVGWSMLLVGASCPTVRCLHRTLSDGSDPLFWATRNVEPWHLNKCCVCFSRFAFLRVC